MTKKTTDIQPRLKELTDALINDVIDEKERTELEALLRGDAAAKEFFTTQCHVHTALSLSAAAEKSVDLARVQLGEVEDEKSDEKPTPVGTSSADQKATRSRFRAHPVRFVTTSLGLLVVCGFAVYGASEFWQENQSVVYDWLPSSSDEPVIEKKSEDTNFTARITGHYEHRWAEQTRGGPPNASIHPGSEPPRGEVISSGESAVVSRDGTVHHTRDPSEATAFNRMSPTDADEMRTRQTRGEVYGYTDGSVQYQSEVSQGFVESFSAVDESSIPFDDNAPLLFANARDWTALTERREKYLLAGDAEGLAAFDVGITGLVRAGILPAGGLGPGQGGDQYDYLPENSFEQVSINPLSTFSIDVDTASYSKVRMYLMQHRQLPPAGAIRLEELINYFRYEYPEPEGDHPVATHVEIASCPWQPDHRLVRVGVQARHIDPESRPPCNLVFLLDVSGSMSSANKLELVKTGFERFVRQLRTDDRVAIVVYAGSSGLVLPSTSGDEQVAILESLNRLKSGGSTNGGAGIALAYSTVRDNFIEDGVNRIILCSDGDFNVGVTSTDALVEMAAEQAKDGIYLTVLGFGMGNHNDAMLEELSNNAEGNYAFIDTLREANKVLVEQMNSTLVTIARDVKIQIEFNPALVQSYRLIGYENRMLAEEDFNDDTVDAGEIGAGHTVTALYEVVPVGIDDTVDTPDVTPLRYQRPASRTEEASSGELLTVNLRYKLPDAEESTHIDQHVSDDDLFFNQATAEFQFAAAVAEFGLILRRSQYAGDANYAEVLELATDNVGEDEFGYRSEFLELVSRAAALTPPAASSEEE